MKNELETKVFSGTKWSFLGEISGKIITPVVNMILARILLPSEFGIIINLTILTSFADILTDGGFQKYVIQKDFSSSTEESISLNVAFWTNFLFSMVIYIIVYFNKSMISSLLGDDLLETLIPIAMVQVIFTSFTSIQVGIMRRNFNFKGLFYNRILTAMIPFLVSVPLALHGFSYWSIIYGNLSSLLISSLLLSFQSKWIPKFKFDLNVLRKMFSFSIWSQGESIFIWLTQWSDSFFVGRFMNSTLLGIYKTGMSTVSSVLQLVSSSTVPAMYSGLSRSQNERDRFLTIFYNMQKVAALFLVPLGIGMFLYSDIVVKILLGSNWAETSFVIANWAITSCIMTIFNTYSIEVYRSIGKPQVATFTQIVNFFILIITLVIFGSKGFELLVISRSWSRLLVIPLHFYLLNKYFKIELIDMFKNIYMYFVAAFIMGAFGQFQKNFYHGMFFDVLGIIFSIILYFSILFLIRKERLYILNLFSRSFGKEK